MRVRKDIRLVSSVNGVSFPPSPLAKYREFHQLYQNAEYVAAGKLLMSLLGSNTVPKRSVVCTVSR